MPSTIQNQISIVQAETGLGVASVIQRTATEAAFSSNSIAVTTTPEDVALGDVVVPRDVVLKHVSGDDVLISLDGGTAWPMSLSGAGDCTKINLDSRTTSLITCIADTAGSLGGKYFVIYDTEGPVWVWLDTGNGAGVAASGEITFGVPVNGDTVVVNGTTLTYNSPTPGAFEFSTIDELTTLVEGLANIEGSDDGFIVTVEASDVGTAGNAYTLALGGGNTGTMAISGGTLAGGVNSSIEPIVTTERLLPVEIVSGDNANTVADKVAAVLDADDSFLCANPAAATLTIVDAGQGPRTTIAAGTSGFTSPSGSTSAPVTIKIKSLSTSQIVVAVAPA